MKNLDDCSVSIIGLGQIGGSIGMDLVQQRIVHDVIGHDIDSSVIDMALEKQAIHRAAHDLDTAIIEADIVILAAPIREIIKVLPHVATCLRQEAICLDVASTKREIMAAVGKLTGPLNYISGHPIAGNESTGITGAETGKFFETVFALVPTAAIGPEQMQLTMQLVKSLGADPIRMDADQHDELIAMTSELPYALAMALAHIAARHGANGDGIWRLAGGSFRSATRVAKSSPELTANMLLSNRKEVDKAIDTLVSELRNLQRVLLTKDAEAIQRYAESAKSVIDRLPR